MRDKRRINCISITIGLKSNSKQNHKQIIKTSVGRANKLLALISRVGVSDIRLNWRYGCIRPENNDILVP